MAGLEETDVIDVVAQDADGEYIVVMVESRPWGSGPEQVDQLKAKINAYAGVILDGSLAEQFPEMAGKPMRIQLDCVDPPSAEVSVITDRAARELGNLGVRFTVNVRG